jgi:hypothetical protein
VFIGCYGYIQGHDSYFNTLYQFQISRELANIFVALSERKRSALMLVHHISFLLALCHTPQAHNQGIVSYQDMFFFGGVVELSNLFYTPKIVMQEVYDLPYTPLQAMVYKWIRRAFFVSFILIRIIWWDFQAMLVLGKWLYTPSTLAAHITMVCLAALTLMQMYWGCRITRIGFKEFAPAQ